MSEWLNNFFELEEHEQLSNRDYVELLGIAILIVTALSVFFAVI